MFSKIANISANSKHDFELEAREMYLFKIELFLHGKPVFFSEYYPKKSWAKKARMLNKINFFLYIYIVIYF